MITKKILKSYIRELDELEAHINNCLKNNTKIGSIPSPQILLTGYILKLGMQPKLIPKLICKSFDDVFSYLDDLFLIKSMLLGILNNRYKYNFSKLAKTICELVTHNLHKN